MKTKVEQLAQGQGQGKRIKLKTARIGSNSSDDGSKQLVLSLAPGISNYS